MKKLMVFMILVTIFSCAKKNSADDLKVKNEVSADTVISEVKNIASDKDLHGCKTTDGYTWSVLKEDCVRIFEIGTRLKPFDEKNAESAAMGAFVIFEENQGNRAELFLVNQANPIMLTRKSEGDSYINGDWKLIPWKGLVLIKGEKILYVGN